MGFRFLIVRKMWSMYHFLLKPTILQILVYARRPERINLKVESLAYGLRLCPADVNKNTFLKDRSNEIIAIDFSCYSLLPLPFVELAFRLGDDFARSVRAHIKLPKRNSWTHWSRLRSPWFLSAATLSVSIHAIPFCTALLLTSYFDAQGCTTRGTQVNIATSMTLWHSSAKQTYPNTNRVWLHFW